MTQQARRERLTTSILTASIFDEGVEPLPEAVFNLPQLVYVNETYTSRFFVTPVEETLMLEDQSQMNVFFHGQANVLLNLRSIQTAALEVTASYEKKE